MIRPEASAVAVVRPVSRATDGLSPAMAGTVARFTVACRGATPVGGSVDAPAYNHRLALQ